jgi:protein-S-isoprenylcysteine O-methyltransferase Ste14
MLGSVIAFDTVAGILSLCLIVVAYYRKLRIEERWLIPHFGDQYRQYQRETKALIPFLF